MGSRRHHSHVYVVFSEERGWLNASRVDDDGMLVRWVAERDESTRFDSIDHALGVCRWIGIELSAIDVMPVPRRGKQ